MPVRVYWSNHNIAIMEFSAPWDVTDLLDGHASLVSLLKESPHPVDIVVDYQKGGTASDGILPHMRRMWATWPRNKQRRLVVVGVTSGMAHTIAEIFSRSFVRLTLVTTMDDAFALLRVAE